MLDRQLTVCVFFPCFLYRYGLEGLVWLAKNKEEEARVQYEGERVTVGGVVVNVFDRVRVRISVDESGVLLKRKMLFQLVLNSCM